MYKKTKNRFSVERAKLPAADRIVECYLVLDDGIPATEINRILLMDGKDYPRPPSTNRYHLCKFLNYLNRHDTEYQDATMEQIFTFLYYMYNKVDVRYNTLKKYIEDIGNLYEHLALFDVPLDKSLYLPWPGTEPSVPQVIKNSRLAPQTKIWYLKAEFRPKKNDAWLKYTKWYTREQYRAIAEKLPLVHRIIFLMTVYLGYRCSSALSIKLSTLNLRNRTVKPSHTKTGQKHVSTMPVELVTLIRSYIENERSRNPGCDSDWLFLNNRGVQMKYNNYNKDGRWDRGRFSVPPSTSHPMHRATVVFGTPVIRAA